MKMFTSKLKFLEEVLIYAYIWQIPFSWRLIIDSSRSRVQDGFNEYMDISLYLGEILVLIALTIHILRYIIDKKSIYRLLSGIQLKKMFHVEQTLILVVATPVLINVGYSIDPILSVSSLFHWLIFGIFFLLLKSNCVPRGTQFFKPLILIFLFSITFQLVVTLFQVINGSSIGLYLFNESILSLNEINVAKSHIFSGIYLRGYGTFPHPNVLAAYALCLILLTQLFSQKMFHVERGLIITINIFSVCVVILTQSKICIVLTILYLTSLYFKKYKQWKVFHVEQFLKILVTLLVLIGIYSLFYFDIRTSIQSRLDQFRFQMNGTELSLYGSGLGTYRLSYDAINQNQWLYEPVHFVPLIVTKEWGVLLVIVFLCLMIYFLKNVPHGTLKEVPESFIFIIILVSIDHYSWDIYQGMFILVMTLSSMYIIDKNRKLLLNNKKENQEITRV
jgi:hypothetical protein